MPAIRRSSAATFPSPLPDEPNIPRKRRAVRFASPPSSTGNSTAPPLRRSTPRTVRFRSPYATAFRRSSRAQVHTPFPHDSYLPRDRRELKVDTRQLSHPFPPLLVTHRRVGSDASSPKQQSPLSMHFHSMRIDDEPTAPQGTAIRPASPIFGSQIVQGHENALREEPEWDSEYVAASSILFLLLQRRLPSSSTTSDHSSACDSFDADFSAKIREEQRQQEERYVFSFFPIRLFFSRRFSGVLNHL